jgi:hypothetical protein
MLKLDPIRRGDDWSYTHTISAVGGSLASCARVSMTWKYDFNDPDSAAAAKITSDPAGGITILSNTSFACLVPHAMTALIVPGDLVVDIQYETLDGRVVTEENLDRNTQCLPDVTRDLGA